MARVLIAWELGEAFGHLARCLWLAHGLIACGHGVTLALNGVRLPGGQAVLSAPVTPHAGAGSRAPVNYADVLRVSGFADVGGVAARLNAWQGLISLVRPNVLVSDHAPRVPLAGVPLGMRARHVKQVLFAHRVEALGAGQLLSSRTDADSVAASLHELLDNPAYRQPARMVRRRHADYLPSQAIEQALFVIERTLFDGWSPDRNRKTQEPQESPPACLH